MNEANDFDWGALEDHVQGDTFKPPERHPSTSKFAKTASFPCTACNGTGRWRGGRTNHNGETKCFACRGEGSFKTSEYERAAKRDRWQATKARRIEEARLAWEEQNPGLTAFLTSATWSEFYQELLGKLRQYGSLTDGQTRAVRNGMAKCEARKAERHAERVAAPKVEVDLSSIRRMFETAASNRAKPIYRAAGLVLKMAPPHGRNPGALYVTDARTGDYLGKILGTVYQGKPAPGLQEIAADPREAAVRYGRKTGTCSCCGAELTNQVSIDLGIGPICREKWGL